MWRLGGNQSGVCREGIVSFALTHAERYLGNGFPLFMSLFSAEELQMEMFTKKK